MIFIKAIRPLHWVKNLLVLAPVFFSGGITDPHLVLLSFWAFAGFCAASGHAYVVNDLADAASDSKDPVRSARPYAAGEIPHGYMITLSAFTAIAALSIGLYIGINYILITAAYIALTYLYTYVLKKFGIAGVAVIAAGMLLRILAGAVAIDAPVSPWVYPCAFILAFYVVAGKRIFDRGGYVESPALEKTVFPIAGIGTAIAYVIYSLSGAGPEKYQTTQLWITAPFVIAAIIRYYQITVRSGNNNGRGEHLRATLTDAPLIAICFAWGIVFAVLIYS